MTTTRTIALVPTMRITGSGGMGTGANKITFNFTKKIMIIQTEIINLEDLVPTNHLYRKFTKLIDLNFNKAIKDGSFTVDDIGIVNGTINLGSFTKKFQSPNIRY
jgi:hypothetical protein